MSSSHTTSRAVRGQYDRIVEAIQFRCFIVVHGSMEFLDYADRRAEVNLKIIMYYMRCQLCKSFSRLLALAVAKMTR